MFLALSLARRVYITVGRVRITIGRVYITIGRVYFTIGCIRTGFGRVLFTSTLITFLSDQLRFVLRRQGLGRPSQSGGGEGAWVTQEGVGTTGCGSQDGVAGGVVSVVEAQGPQALLRLAAAADALVVEDRQRVGGAGGQELVSG